MQFIHSDWILITKYVLQILSTLSGPRPSVGLKAVEDLFGPGKYIARQQEGATTVFFNKTNVVAIAIARLSDGVFD